MIDYRARIDLLDCLLKQAMFTFHKGQFEKAKAALRIFGRENIQKTKFCEVEYYSLKDDINVNEFSEKIINYICEVRKS